MTTRLASLISARSRPAALVVIKAAHTAIFLSVAALIVLFAWDGLRQRPAQRTAIAPAVAIAESAVYVSNNQVCPLSPLAEELGAASGSVTDIFLPEGLSQRVPLIFGGILVLASFSTCASGWVVVRFSERSARSEAPHAPLRHDSYALGDGQGV
jgi:hypothetical protein